MGAAEAEHLGDGRREVDAETDHARDAELEAEREVVAEADVLVAVLLHSARRADDEAKERVAEPSCDLSWIERRERRHDVVGRAERVVLVPVLDVRDAVAIE